MNRPRTGVASEDLRGAVGDDLVRVHIRGCAGACLEDIEDELDIVLAVHDLLRGRFDRRRRLRRDAADLLIDLRGGALDQREGADEAAGESQVADGEIADGALRLRAPQGIVRHLHLTH